MTNSAGMAGFNPRYGMNPIQTGKLRGHNSSFFTTCLLLRNSSRVRFLGLISEFRLLVKEAMTRVKKWDNSVADL